MQLPFSLRKAKEKFLAKTMPNEIEKYRVVNMKQKDSLEEIFDEWYMVKEGTITDKALQTYNSKFQKLPEKLKKTNVSKIRTSDLMQIMKEATPRQYEELHTIFNSLFKYAIASGVVSHNPVALIPFKRAERLVREPYPPKKYLLFYSELHYLDTKELNKGYTYFISSAFALVSLTKKPIAKATS